MIAVVQRVTTASVCRHDHPSTAIKINQGFCVFLAVSETDTEIDAEKIAAKYEESVFLHRCLQSTSRRTRAKVVSELTLESKLK